MVSVGPAPRISTSSTADVSNHTSSPGVALALAQVAEVGNVLGVALVGPEGDAVAHHSLMGLPASAFSDVFRRVRDSLHAFENLESSASQALALYFESATVLVRWVENHALVVIGTELVHPTVLSVSVNASASKLAALAKQAGGAAVAFRSTISAVADNEISEPGTGVVARPMPTDPVPDSIIARLTQLYAKPLGAVGRLAIQQRLKGGKPTFAAYPDFVRRLAALIEDNVERDSFVDDALRLAPHLDVRAVAAARASAAGLFRHRRAAAAPSPPPQPPQPPPQTRVRRSRSPRRLSQWRKPRSSSSTAAVRSKSTSEGQRWIRSSKS